MRLLNILLSSRDQIIQVQEMETNEISAVEDENEEGPDDEA